MANMERLGKMLKSNFWKNKNVFITGHTGFKGSWLSLWLHDLGANVTGYALNPPTNPSLYNLAKIDTLLNSFIADIRDRYKLFECLTIAKPDIVFHLAAQPLVRDSYKIPIDTYEINVLGTANILEAIRQVGKTVRAFINVTTDKVYENQEWCWGYRENEPLGGYDPYSSSKACSELITAAYRKSYFTSQDNNQNSCSIATARAGNVIGGGDWATDRLIPDCIKSLINNKPILIRNPTAIRPWQHVLEPLHGYLVLAEKLYDSGTKFAGAWNFGPTLADNKTVEWIVKKICNQWGNNATFIIDKNENMHEATYLKLDISKANTILGWEPRWNLEKSINSIVQWYTAWQGNADMRKMCQQQISDYENA